MHIRNIEDRLDRLERNFLLFASMITGEARAAATSEAEFEAVQRIMAIELQEMASELNAK